MARSLNKVQLIGNLTRDPELRYTPSGAAVCTIGLATNRQWTTDQGEKKEEVEWHKLVAWNKLAELCAQLLAKGRKIYVEGRLQTRKWTGQDGVERSTTEIVINDMLILDSKGGTSGGDFDGPQSDAEEAPIEDFAGSQDSKGRSSQKSNKKTKTDKSEDNEPEEDEDIPF